MGFEAWHTSLRGNASSFRAAGTPTEAFENEPTICSVESEGAVIDGELISLDSQGRNLFNELLLKKGCPIFYAFDLLHRNGHASRQLPLIKQRKIADAHRK